MTQRVPMRDYDYDLPPDRIAQGPAEPRDGSRLMVLDRRTGNPINLTTAEEAGLHLGDITVKTIVLYFSFEVLVGELRGELRKIALGVLAGLLLLAVRGVV